MFDCNNIVFPSLGEKKTLDKEYKKDELIDMAIDEWTVYFECHKCGRWDYCKFAEKHPSNPERSIDIKCGVVKDIIRNYFNTTFDLAKILEDKESRQAYINSGYYLAQYTFQSETYIGLLMKEEMLSFWDSYAPSVIGSSKQLRDLLDKLHAEMSKVHFLNSLTTNLYVEGESEKIIATNFISDRGVSIISYEGKGRMTYLKMEYLFKTTSDKGYKVYVQGDLDGKAENQNINKMVQKGILSKENTFLFKHDLETSYPIELLHESLQTLCDFGTSLEEFKSDIPTTKSIVAHLKDKYKIDIPKTKVAEHVSTKIDVAILNNDEFKETEFGKFLLFCFKAGIQK